MSTLVYSPHAAPLRAHLSPRRLAAGLWAHRGLIAQLAAREVRARYRSHALGPLWALLQPLAMLAIFTFVFAVVFRARWSQGGGVGEVALQIFAGLIVFQFFREIVGRAPGLVVGHSNFVKRVVFPLEVLPVVEGLAAAFAFGINLLVWLVGWLLIARALPHPALLMVPVYLVPVCLGALGLAWALASLGVFVRDTQNLTELGLTVLFFMTPVFYSADAIPEPYRSIILANPVAQTIGWTRGSMLAGSWPSGADLAWWLVYTASSAAFALLGYALFMKSRRAFADIL